MSILAVFSPFGWSIEVLIWLLVILHHHFYPSSFHQGHQIHWKWPLEIDNQSVEWIFCHFPLVVSPPVRVALPNFILGTKRRLVTVKDGRETFLNDIHNSGFEKIGHEAFEIHMIRAWWISQHLALNPRVSRTAIVHESEKTYLDTRWHRWRSWRWFNQHWWGGFLCCIDKNKNHKKW